MATKQLERWTEVPTEDAVRHRLQVVMARHADFHAAMCDSLEAGSDEYPNGDDAITNIAYAVLGRGKRIEDITDADAALIGWHIAEWFHMNALSPIVRAEQAIAAQRLDDEAAEIAELAQDPSVLALSLEAAWINGNRSAA